MSMQQVFSRPPQKYLGNRNTQEVHDLDHERGSCQINEILTAGHAVIFIPDSLLQAQAHGFDRCHWCLGASTR